MKYLKKFNEALSELQYSQRYTGGNRPALTSEIKVEIDKIHSGCTKEDIEDVFREIYDEEIGRVTKVEFYYGIDKQKERFYGYSHMRVEVIIDDESKKNEYFKIRSTAIDRIRDMYGYSSAGHYHLLRQNDDGQEIDKLDFNSTKIYWITPRMDESVGERLGKQEIEELLDYIDDIFYDLKEEGYTLDYGGSLLNISIYKIGKHGGSLKYNLSEISGTVKMLHNYIISTGLKLEYIGVEGTGRWRQELNPIRLEDIDNIGEITVLKMKYPEKI